MESYRASAATPPGYELAEGVLWDDAFQLVRWVDINAGRILSAQLDGLRLTSIESMTLGQTAGAVALAGDRGLLLAGARGLIAVSVAGTVSVGPDLMGDRSQVRLNDGAVDPQGRFVVGTLSLAERTDKEVLLRVSPNGDVETLRDGIGLSNGVAWSPDGTTIYHVDTFTGAVAAHSYSGGAFDADEPWTTILDDFPGQPDGLTVDSEGMLWVAQWDAGCVRRFDPNGTALATVEVNAPQASCMAFVGPGLDILAITTATEGLAPGRSDDSGALFLARVGATGLPSPRWAGSTSEPYWATTDRIES